MYIYVIQYTCWLYLLAILHLGILFYISHVYGSFQQCVIVTSVFVFFFFVNFISMVTEICLCTSCYLLLSCTNYWESWRAYLQYIICYAIFSILVDLHSRYWINIYLFELFVTCIETHRSVPKSLISHIFVSIINFSFVSYYYSVVILNWISAPITWNIEHSNAHIQHHIYTTF